MNVAEEGSSSRTFSDYSNSPMLDEDLKVLLLSRGERIPQNAYEKQLKEELDRIKKEGFSFEVGFD